MEEFISHGPHSALRGATPFYNCFLYLFFVQKYVLIVNYVKYQ